MELLKIDKSQISIDPEEILSFLGSSGGELDRHTLEIIENYIAECLEIMSPKGAYAIFEAVESDSKVDIEIEGTVFHTGKIIRNILRNSELYTFFAVTAGPEPERLAKSLIENSQFLEGYIVDMIGSGMVESVADQVHNHIKNLTQIRGQKATNRYSPGYCSWDVSEQQKLFSLLPDGCCGITLSDSSMMTPIKSISSIVGIGSAVEYKDYYCEICSMKNCLYRKTKG